VAVAAPDNVLDSRPRASGREVGRRRVGKRRRRGGRSSAAIRAKAPKTETYHDLRADYHEEPIAELRRIYETAKRAARASARTPRGGSSTDSEVESFGSDTKLDSRRT
jgi:uncharacterized Ntn-hydrolase superfamily protein